jgi:hypothetical protein
MVSRHLLLLTASSFAPARQWISALIPGHGEEVFHPLFGAVWCGRQEHGASSLQRMLHGLAAWRRFFYQAYSLHHPRPAASSLRGWILGWWQGELVAAKDCSASILVLQFGSLVVLCLEWVSAMTAVWRPSSQDEGAAPLRSWKRTARQRLASLGLDKDNSVRGRCSIVSFSVPLFLTHVTGQCFDFSYISCFFVVRCFFVACKLFISIL